MKFLSKITCLLILVLLTNCQVSDKLTPRQKWWKYQDKMTKMFPTTPPNGVWLRDSIFLDETEITNADYLEFLLYIKDSSTSFRETMQLDSPPWGEVTYRKDGISYPWTPIGNYSVVGVSYQQAQAFCKWRSDAVNIALKGLEASKHSKAEIYKKLREKYDIEFRWRLPTIEEWNYALATDLVKNTYGIDTISKRYFPYRFQLRDVQEMLKKEKSKKLSLRQIKRDIIEYYKANPYYNRIKYCLAEPPYFDLQYVESKLYSHSYSYPSLISRYNHFSHGRGFYNLVGNAAEMVTSGDSVFVVGGSFLNTLDELKPPNKTVYTKPEAYIGFRCVAEMKIKVKKIEKCVDKVEK